MKNKKSKIVAPALGLILLSTAASISGSVAWFTANRTATVTGGTFAVVKTSDNLAVTLGAGVGTAVNNTTKAVTTKHNYVLTDASFDHTAGALNVVTPDTPREKVLLNTPIASLAAGDAAAELLVNRGINTYSAFTWTMTFTLDFSASATKKQGLFLDLGADDTYMHEVVKQTIASGDLSTTDAAGLFEDEELTTPAKATQAGKIDATQYTGEASYDFYKESNVAPDSTGKAFRIAFVPTAVADTGDNTHGSKFYTKVWADNEAQTPANLAECKFIDGAGVGDLLVSDGSEDPANPTAYDTETGSWSYVTDAWKYASATAGEGKVLMKSGDNTRIPTDGDNGNTDSALLASNSNYLGFFNVNPGASVAVTFTCVAWFEGSHPEIVNSATDFERIVSSMKFGLSELKA